MALGEEGQGHDQELVVRLVFDPSTGRVAATGGGAPSPDGKLVVNERAGRAELTDRSTGAVRGASTWARAPRFSPEGRWLYAIEGGPTNGTREVALHVYDVAQATDGPAIDLGLGGNRVDGALGFSARDERIAVLVVVKSDAHFRCPGGKEPMCAVVKVFDLPSKRLVATVPIPALWAKSTLAMSPDGRKIAVDDGVYDVASGKRLFQAPDQEQLGPFTRDSRAIYASKFNWVLRDAATGNVTQKLDGQPELLDVEQGFALVSGPGGLERLNLATGVRVPVAPRFRVGSALLLGGAFVLAPDDDGAFRLVRVADGAKLRLAFAEDGILALGDDGTFDGPEIAWSLASYRMGTNVLRNRLAPLAELAHRFRKPGMYVDFIAGR